MTPPRVKFPECTLCGQPDPYFCRECEQFVCTDCFGPFGECKHEKYEKWEGSIKPNGK